MFIVADLVSLNLLALGLPCTMYDSMHVLETILCYGTCMLESNKEGKDQELIQSSTTPDPGHHTGK